MKIALLPVCLALGVVAASSAVSAAPITYTETVVGSGTLGAQSFTDALITLTFVGDTTNVAGSPGYYENTSGTGTISVANIGSGGISGTYVFVNQDFAGSGIAGIATAAGSVLETYADPFMSYGLGSISTTTGPAFFRSDLSFATDLGDFNLQSANEATFSASMTVSAVPLPASLPLFGAAVLALVGFAVVRRKASA